MSDAARRAVVLEAVGGFARELRLTEERVAEMRRDAGPLMREVRREVGLTLRDVAAVADVSVPHLSHMEGGSRRVTLEVLDALYRAVVALEAAPVTP